MRQRQHHEITALSILFLTGAAFLIELIGVGAKYMACHGSCSLVSNAPLFVLGWEILLMMYAAFMYKYGLGLYMKILGGILLILFLVVIL